MLLIFKVAAIPIGIVVLFLIYWILPNRRIPPARVAPVAILAGLVLEAMKYVFLLIWPLLHIKLEREYGVFRNAATILIWGFASAMIVLAAARAPRGVSGGPGAGGQEVRFPVDLAPPAHQAGAARPTGTRTSWPPAPG